MTEAATQTETQSVVILSRYRKVGKGARRIDQPLAIISDQKEAMELKSSQEVINDDKGETPFYDVWELPVYKNVQEFQDSHEKAREARELLDIVDEKKMSEAIIDSLGLRERVDEAREMLGVVAVKDEDQPVKPRQSRKNTKKS